MGFRLINTSNYSRVGEENLVLKGWMFLGKLRLLRLEARCEKSNLGMWKAAISHRFLFLIFFKQIWLLTFNDVLFSPYLTFIPASK